MEELHGNIEEICSAGDIHNIRARLIELLRAESLTKDKLLSIVGSFGFDEADSSSYFIRTEYAEEFIYAFEVYVENLQFFPIPSDDEEIAEGTCDSIENILCCDNIHNIRRRLIDLLWTESQTTDGCNHFVKTEYAEKFVYAFEQYVESIQPNTDKAAKVEKTGEGYFDASIISAQFKPGTVWAQVNARSFDEEKFKECVGEAADHSDFIEILVIGSKPDDGHFVTGELVFVDVGQKGPEFFYTEENGTKFLNEVSFLKEGEKLLSVGMSEKMAESNIDEELKPKYKVGDELTYINDYCVNWGLRTITDMVQDQWGWSYYISPTDTPWCPVREKNLYVPGTEPTFDLELNNGMTAKLVETDWNGNRYYNIGGRIAVLTDGFLYTTVGDFAEACCRLDEQFQPKSEGREFSLGQDELKCDSPTLPEAETVEKTTGNDYFSTRTTDKKSAPSRGMSLKR